MTKTEKIDIFEIISYIILVLFLLLFPFIIFSQGAPTGPNSLTYECFDGTYYGNCTFDDLVRAVNNVVDTVIPIVLGLIVVVIAYAGFNYMISGDNASKRTEANAMLRKAATGIFFMLAAWLIVSLIADALVDPDVPRILGE